VSSENVELTHRVHDAFNRRDLDGFLALMDPDIQVFSRLAAVEGGD
jgi:ketosteroid isomerase-like protein